MHNAVTSADPLSSLEEALEDAFGFDEGSGQTDIDNPEVGIRFENGQLALDFAFLPSASTTASFNPGDIFQDPILLQLGVGLNLEASIGIDLTDTTAGKEMVFVQLHDLTASATVDVPNLDLVLNIPGVGSAGIQGGAVHLAASITAELVDPNADGKLSLTELLNGLKNLSEFIDVTAVGAMDATLPLEVTVGGFNLSDYGTPVVTVRGDDILHTSPQVGVDILISPDLRDQILGVLQDLDDKLGPALEGLEGLLATQLPVVGTSVGGLLGVSDVTALFRLRDIAEPYLIDAGFTYTGSSFPTLFGLFGKLNDALSAAGTGGFDIDNPDARGGNFAGLDFSDLELRGFDFRGADLRGAVLTGADLILRNIDFAPGFNKALSSLDLRHANLAGLDLRGFDLSDVRLSGANLAEAIADANTSLQGALLHGVDLSGIDGIELADLAGSFFDNLTKVPSGFAVSGFFGLFTGTVDATLPDVFGAASDAPPFSVGGGFDFNTHEVMLNVQVNLHPRFEIDFDLDTVALGLADVGVGLRGAGTLTAGAVIELGAGVGIDLDALNPLDSERPELIDSVFFTLDVLRVGAGVRVSGLNLAAELGPLSGGVEGGHASLVVGAQVDVTDPNSDGRITLAELSQAQIGFGVLGTLEAELPLAVTLPVIGTITDFGTPTVLISAPHLIAGSAPNFTVNRPSVSVNILLDNQDVQDNILALLDDLRTNGFGAVGFLDDDLPLVGKSINELVGAGIGDLLDLHTSIKGYFDSFDPGGSSEAGTPDLAGLVDWVIEAVSERLSTLSIGGDLSDGPFTMSGGLDFSTNTLLFQFNFDLNKSTNVQIDVDELVPGGGFIDFGGAINAELLGSVSAGFGLGLNLDELFGGTASDAVFLTFDEVMVSGALHISDLDLTVSLGTAVSGGIEDGRLDLELGAMLVIADPNGDGRLTLSEIQAAGFSNLVSLDASASVDAALPLQLSVAGFDPTQYGQPVVYLLGDNFLQFDPAGTPKFTFNRPNLVFDIKLTADFRDAVLDVLADLDAKIDSVVSGPVGTRFRSTSISRRYSRRPSPSILQRRFRDSAWTWMPRSTSDSGSTSSSPSGSASRTCSTSIPATAANWRSDFRPR